MDYINWPCYFMNLAFITSLRSKDPSAKHGSVIVNPTNNHVIALGYNGFPKGDDSYPLNRKSDKGDWDTKYPYMIHSEMNAIFNCTDQNSLRNSTLYLYSPKRFLPCSDCMKSIIQVGINKIVLIAVPKENTDKYDWTATRSMIEKAFIQVEELGENFFIEQWSQMKEFYNKEIVNTESFRKIIGKNESNW